MVAIWFLVGGLFGLVAGSFVGAWVMRWPKGESVLQWRSRCDHCYTTLAPLQLIPLISYLVLRGSCAACGARISHRHVVVEIAGAAIGALAFAASPDLAGVAGAGFGWGLLGLAMLDAEHFWLPNAITIPLLLMGLAFGALDVSPDLLDRVIGAAAGYVAFRLIGAAYRSLRGRTGLGAGDAKLIAAIGAWLGWQCLPFVILVAAAAGLGWAVILSARGKPLRLTSRLPLGTLLACSAWTTWLVTAAAPA